MEKETDGQRYGREVYGKYGERRTTKREDGGAPKYRTRMRMTI